MSQTIKNALITGLLIIFLLLTTGFSFDSSGQDNSNKRQLVSGQIWAVQVTAEPGESAKLEQSFEAAHGPYDGTVDKDSADEVDKDSFGIVEDEDGTMRTVKGEDYVGSYFHIEQLAHTTGGTLKRYIDISSPWSHGYLHEDMSVIGTATIGESFSMENLAPGSGAAVTWFDLF